VSIEPQAADVERLARRLGGPAAKVSHFSCITGGASKRTYMLDLDTAEAHAYVVQLWQPPPEISAEPDILPRVAPREDAALQRLVASTGARVPDIVHLLDDEDGLGLGYVSARIAGEALGRRVVSQESLQRARAALGEQCAASLAATHRAPLDQALRLVPKVGVAALIERFRALLNGWDYASPLLEWALCWLEDHQPAQQRWALCHGDFRTGNFIVGPDGLRAVLDWELASIGDPAQDLGWLCVRSWRFGGSGSCGGFTTREEFLVNYLRYGGIPMTLDDVLYWEAFGNVRWALHCVRRGLRHAGTRFSVEDAGVGRRLAEPLQDFLELVDSYGQ
jgi:aminoglycoside phosphotransferase (APT) family kinase protein